MTKGSLPIWSVSLPSHATPDLSCSSRQSGTSERLETILGNLTTDDSLITSYTSFDKQVNTNMIVNKTVWSSIMIRINFRVECAQTWLSYLSVMPELVTSHVTLPHSVQVSSLHWNENCWLQLLQWSKACDYFVCNFWSCPSSTESLMSRWHW